MVNKFKIKDRKMKKEVLNNVIFYCKRLKKVNKYLKNKNLSHLHKGFQEEKRRLKKALKEAFKNCC